MSGRAPRIGVAVSGGGFRATAFGLGCCRALHDTGLLPHVSVMSGISGGSLLTALYAYGPSNFDKFDATTVDLLHRGLQAALIRRTFAPAAVARNLFAASRAALSRDSGEQPHLRTANRTDALRDELAHRFFADRTVEQVTHPNLATVITATDLRTGNAVRFGSLRSSCSAYGIIAEPIAVAEAVAASAAFPVLLPAMERSYTFSRSPNAQLERHPVSLTDGGIYDNLGLTVLEPQRSTAYTPHVYDLDYVISCDAGRGSLPSVAGHFAGTRLRRSFDIVHRRSQDASRAKLHAAVDSGMLRGVVHSYLGMPDKRLPTPVVDLVPDATRTYPTNFSAMSRLNIELIVTRGEQLTRSLIGHYCPDLA